MRDVLVTAIAFGAIPFVLRRPYVGILLWSWLSYMNPHRLTWGFAFNMPFAQVTAIATLVAMFMSREPGRISRIPFNKLTALWALFLVWMVITTIFAFYVEFATEQLIKIAKVQFVTFLTILLINDKAKLEQLLWVIVLSLCFFTVKGGLFTIQTAGAFRVWGPVGSYIEDNNALAVASIMIIPLMFYLRSTLTRAWARHGMLFAILLTAVSAAGSYSRSAFVAGACVTVYLVWKSKRRAPALLVLIIALPFIFTFMPESWHERMATITDPTQEASAHNRLEAWATAISIANSRLTGGGLEPWSTAVYQTYGPSWVDSTAGGRNAHSIYFNVLAEHGWIGLALFMLIFFLAWQQASRVARVTATRPDLGWAGDLARMLQVSFVAYGSGGATLTLGYFDLPWHLVAISLILTRHVDARIGEPAVAAEAARGTAGSHSLAR